MFAFASPENKASTGPLERFALLLQHAQHRPLLGHAASTTVQRMQSSDSVYMEIVEVTPRAESHAAPGAAAGPAGSLLYVWVLRRQPQSSNWRGCWMTDSVQVRGCSSTRQAVLWPLIPWHPWYRGTQQRNRRWHAIRRDTFAAAGAGPWPLCFALALPPPLSSAAVAWHSLPATPPAACRHASSQSTTVFLL